MDVVDLELARIAKRMRAHVRAIECVHILRNCARRRLSTANRVARECREDPRLPYLATAADTMGRRAFRDCGKYSNALRRLRAYEYFPKGA